MEIKNLFTKVRAFQIATEQTVNAVPTELEHIEQRRRYHLMIAKNQEYCNASYNKDNPATLNALVDMAYILFGTINEHGMQNVFEDAFNRVHEVNMSKIVDGKAIKTPDGQIVKPIGFVPVVLQDLVNKNI